MSGMPRALTAGTPVRAHGLAPFAVARTRGGAQIDGVFWMALAAIAAQLTLSSNVLLGFGIAYASPGGSPLAKFHLGTYLAAAAVLIAARRHRPLTPRLLAEIARRPAFPFAAAAMLACACYATLTTGMSGTAVYIESYTSAALLGFALESQDPAQRRAIGRALLAVLLLNAALCIGETLLQTRLVPVQLVTLAGTTEVQGETAGEFRGTALYDSPLTGAMMTMMGVFLCLASDLRPWRRAAVLGVLMVGLVTFGGRSALLVTCVTLALLGIGETLRRLLARRIDGKFLGAMMAVLLLAPVAAAGVLLGTHLADRILARTYVDDSALVRLLQWSIFGRMDTHDWLFGMDGPRLDGLMLQVGLDPPFNDIENFWLLVFFSLGLSGFVVWLVGLAAILRRLWREGGVLPRATLLAVLLVASGSNSLGRKSNILFIAVAVVMSEAAFRVAPRNARTVRPACLRPPRPTG